tara:strand:- start:2845 stop:3453 length:609 start_codon:yes stop_codon:yes gene_type:complete
MNKGNLRSHFKAVLNRSDITDALADTFIDQGIARIQRSLRIPSMEKKHTYTISSSTDSVVIPSDFLEAIDIYFDGKVLARLPMRDMQSLKKNAHNGSPLYFSREQGNFLLYPSPASGTLVINYYASYAIMVADTDENVLASIASDLIIYSALTYASDYYLDERSVVFDNKFSQFMLELQEQANDQELTGTLQKVRPAYQLDY